MTRRRPQPVMTVERFAHRNAALVDHYIHMVNPTLQIDTEERKLWVREDTYLRDWAHETGVRDL